MTAEIEHHPRRRTRYVAGALVVVALVVAGVGAWSSRASSDHADMTSTTMVAPEGVLDLASVSDGIALEYRYAATHADDYGQLRCWCGCEKAFDHRSLADCFVRADGRWEAHGAGCGVCIGEAVDAHRSIDRGVPLSELARDLDARYGPSPDEGNPS